MINNPTYVLWLSRHQMTEDQKNDLAQRLTALDGGQKILPSDLEIISKNVTFPAHSQDAVKLIRSLVEDLPVNSSKHWEYKVVTGVFPSHIAARISQMNLNGVEYFIPVSVPAPAVEGEERGGGFVHSHWEAIAEMADYF